MHYHAEAATHYVPPSYGLTATESPIQKAFTAFHEANPWVLTELARIARAYKRMGRTRIGMKHLIEVLRWEHAQRTESAEQFRINNSFPSRYVRLLSREYPDVADMFEVRRLRA